MELVLSDADGSVLPCDTFIVDINVADAGGKVIASVSANADVEVARAKCQCLVSDGCVVAARVEYERL
jgi:hypothetical protein